jgi:putative transposase
MKKKKDKSKIKKNKKNKKEFYKNKLNILKDSILNFSKNVPLYNLFLEDKNIINTNSFYDMYSYKVNNIDNNNYTFYTENKNIEKEKLFKCKKICLKPTLKQKEDLILMMEGYRIVYNLTVNFINKREYLRKKNEKIVKDENIKISRKKFIEKDQIKVETKKVLNNIIDILSKEEDIKERKNKRIKNINNFLNNDNYEMILDYKILRTYFLKTEINEISIKYKTPIHTLNKAVSLACASFKSALTNLKNKNIKTFKIRKIKSNKRSLLIDIEKSSFTKDGKSFIKSVLGKEVLNKNNINYTINNDCKLHYNKDTNKFILLIPEEVKILNSVNNNNYISIDPGLRTFLNCTTNSSYVEIGSNIKDKLKTEILRLDKINLIKKNKIKNKYLRIRRNKIKNKVNDMHWKIINYLTNTYKIIIIGKWSTKSIISNYSTIFNGVNKRIIQSISFYSFLEKLKYKCLIKNINLNVIDEHYTSKMCSCCGNIKKDLKGDKIYNCTACNISIDRDYNGSRNIFFKSIKYIL